ncbi:MAG: T9SS type A sorting domain-containing protein [Flavobacterium johnsoniae]|nr:MAG: T9SS type A sorting domain-containing protein [Flavobacterium johnsoniae]
MRKITLLLMLFVSCLSYGQTWEITSCYSSNFGSNMYGPMYSVAGANSANRIAVIYPRSQLTGIAGQVLDTVYFKRMTATGTMAGTPNFKIYLKETTNTTWGSGNLDWATAITGATSVYDSNPATAIGSSEGWKKFVLSTPFTYSGEQNLAVFFEYTNTTASTEITWNYEYTAPCINTNDSNTTKYSNNNSGTLPASLGSSDFRRPLIAFGFNVSCNFPAGLASANVASNSATINWTVPAVAPSEGYEYYLSTSATTPLPSATPTGSVGAGITTKNLEGLPSATQHYVWVRSNCGPGDKSVWVGTSFTTLCATYTPTYLQDFNGTAFPPICWSKGTGGDEVSGPTSIGTGIWVADGFLNNGSIGSARVNLYSSNRKGWLISPAINMSAGSYRVRFEYAAKDYYAANFSGMGSDDKVVFLASQDNGATWTVLHTWDSTNSPTNARALYSVNLPAYTGANTKFAFYATDGPVDDTPDYNFYVDNFLVEAIPSCESPVNVSFSGITNAGATISWDAVAGSTGYEYVFDQVATSPTGAGTQIAATPYTASSLAGNTTYYFHVRNNCGSEFSTWTTGSFKTLPDPPVNDDCIDAVALTVNADLLCSVKTAGTLLGATDSGEPDNGAGTPDDDVWYSFTATAETHRVRLLNVTGTPTDLVHEILEGNCGGGLVSLNISDPDTSTVNGLIPGTTYYIRVFSYGANTNATTTFDICVGTFPPPPANDNCADAVMLTVNPDASCAAVSSGDLTSATDSGEADNGVGTPNDDVWYKFVATQVVHKISLLNVAGSPTDLVHEVLEGICGGGLISRYVSDADVSTASGLTVGTTYYVRVFSNSSNPGATSTFNVCVGVPPVGSVCGNPILITALPYTTTDNTNLYGDDYDFPNGGNSGCSGTSNYYLNGDDVVYAYTPTANTSINIRIPAAPGYTGILVYTNCGDIGTAAVACASGSSSGNREINNFSVIAGTTYYIVLSSWPSPQSFAYTLNITENTCTNPTVAFSKTSNCGVSPEFFVNANITSLGTATSLTVTDNQSSPAQQVTATGTVQFGPYPNNTLVILTVANNQDANCVVTSPAQTQTVCPPVNDECANAVLLIPGTSVTCSSPVSGTTVGATQSLPGCAGTADDDVWYKFVATETALSIIITNVAGSGTSDIVTQVFDSCGGTSVVCQDTPNSPVNLTGLTVGNTYFFRIYSYASTLSTTFTVCVTVPPSPPVNDNCSGAIVLTPTSAFGNVTDGTNVGATASSEIAPTICGGYSGGDVWYSVVVPASGSITIQTGNSSTGATGFDSVVTVYSGTCGSLVQLGCNDDSGGTSYSKVAITGQTPGATLYIRVYEYSNDSVGSFGISAYDASLTTTTFKDNNFRAYPNPVVDVLNLSYTQEISNVSVFNLLGQQVLTKTIGATDASVDMSSLAGGTYLVKVAVGDQVKTIKVIKQ